MKHLIIILMVLLVGCGSVEDRGCVYVSTIDDETLCDGSDIYEIVDSNGQSCIVCTYLCGINPDTGDCGAYTITKLMLDDGYSELMISVPLDPDPECYQNEVSANP